MPCPLVVGVSQQLLPLTGWDSNIWPHFRPLNWPREYILKGNFSNITDAENHRSRRR